MKSNVKKNITPSEYQKKIEKKVPESKLGINVISVINVTSATHTTAKNLSVLALSE